MTYFQNGVSFSIQILFETESKFGNPGAHIYPTIASYADILPARHAIFLPHERLLKQRFVGEGDCVTSLKNVIVGG